MATVTVKRSIRASLAKVWASWDDFGNIYKFNPNLQGSHLLERSPETGVGARRQCDLADGKNYIREKVVGYEPERHLSIDIYEGTMPLKSAKADFTFRQEGAEQVTVTMTMHFVPKFGLLGALMVPMMKPKFRSMLQAMLDGNAAYVEYGQRVTQAA